MKRFILPLAAAALLPQAAAGKSVSLNDYYGMRAGKNLPVVYELPQDAARQAAVAYISEMSGAFNKGSELIDASAVPPETLKEKLKDGFILYSAVAPGASILGSIKLPKFEFSPDSLKIDGKVISGRLRFIFLAKNPYSNGFCQVYAAASNELLNGINSMFHGPASYHVFKGGKEEASGSYDENFKFASDKLSLADAVEDINEFFLKAENVHPDLLASLQPEEYTALKKRTVNVVSEKMDPKGLVAVKDLAYELYYAASAFGDGHTDLQYKELPAACIQAARFPPFLFEFRNGAFYVTSAFDKDLTGAEILSLNGVPFRDFAKPVLDRCSGELFHFKANKFARNQRFWWAISGLFSGLKNFDLEFRDARGRKEVKKLEASDADAFAGLGQGAGQKNGKGTSLELLENGSLAYFRYPSFRYSDSEKKAIDGIFSEIKKAGAKSLVIDIRGNGGGNSSMGEFIFKYVSERAIRSFSRMQVKVSRELLANPRYADTSEDLRFSPGLLVTQHVPEEKQQKPEAFFDGKVYLLTDNGTFSSASDFAAMFRDYECGTIIGYETGGLPTCFGDVFSLGLTNSGINFGVSYKKFYGPRPRPGDDEHGVLPDVPVNGETLAEYKTPDPVLTFAVDYIKRGK